MRISPLHRPCPHRDGNHQRRHRKGKEIGKGVTVHHDRQDRHGEAPQNHFQPRTGRTQKSGTDQQHGAQTEHQPQGRFGPTGQQTAAPDRDARGIPEVGRRIRPLGGRDAGGVPEEPHSGDCQRQQSCGKATQHDAGVGPAPHQCTDKDRQIECGLYRDEQRKGTEHRRDKDMQKAHARGHHERQGAHQEPRRHGIGTKAGAMRNGKPGGDKAQHRDVRGSFPASVTAIRCRARQLATKKPSMTRRAIAI